MSLEQPELKLDTEVDEPEPEPEPEEEKKDTDTMIELQLGDVIQITNPSNDNLNDQTFLIDYIDKSKTFLINTETMKTIRVPISPEGIIGDGNITRIAILSRSDTPSYARQNGLLPGKWINIYFGGDFPIIITGKITNLENDMIEVKTVDDDVIYINFDYKGLPEDLPIQTIELREKPSTPLVGEPEALPPVEVEEEEEPEPEPEPIQELAKEKTYVEPEQIQLNVPIRHIKEQIREFIVRADQVKFGDEIFGPITQYIDVATKEQRYSLETQISDLNDELLSTIPNAERTPRVLNNIHIMIERFKQLREHFSFFDQYGNIEGASIKQANYKPLIQNLKEFKLNLYWILPVVKNVKKLYDVENLDEETTDVINIDLKTDLTNIKELMDMYKSNTLPAEQNKYSTLYNDLKPYFTPFNLIDDENRNAVLDERETFTDINTIVDNLEDLYSSVFHAKSVKTRRFVIQKYNTALTKLDTIESTGSKFVTVRTGMGRNDTLSIKSIITLPEPVMRFSKINLPGTSILDRANLNQMFLNYWQLLKKGAKTGVNTVFIDDLDTDIEFNEHNFATSIKNFCLNVNEEMRRLAPDVLYNSFIKTIVPKTKIIFNLMKKYIVGKLSIVDVVSYLEPFLIYTDDLTFMQYNHIVEFINEKISEYNKKFIERSRLFKGLGKMKGMSGPVFTREFSVIDILDKKLRNDVFLEGYDIHVDNLQSTTNSEIIKKMTVKDYSRYYTVALSMQNFPLMYPSSMTDILDREKEELSKDLKKEQGDEKCHPIVIAKYYSSEEELANDNDKHIYFDKRYDKTNYGVLEDAGGYAKEVMTLSPDELRAHIKKDLMEKKKMQEKEAEYLANTLVDGYKSVIDGQYAVLYKGYNENYNNETDFYIREKNKWVLDEKLNKEKVNTLDSSILCNLQEKCISNNDKCESTKEDELGLQTKLMKDIISEFDTNYKASSQELQKIIQDKFAYYENIIPKIIKLQGDEFLKYNNQKYKLGYLLEEDDAHRPKSPFEPLLNLILGQKDFIKKQQDIIKFVDSFTRKSIDGYGPSNEKETPNWLYCNKTGIRLLPTFVYNLASAYIIEGQYKYLDYLEQVKATIGKESDDGDYWVDKHSGWNICPVDFSFEEGYEDGFKVNTRAVMEEDAGAKLVSALAKTTVKYDTPDTKMINNIVNTLCIAMGINIENQKEFIMNCVLDAIKSTVEQESDYKQKVREMAEKGKKMMSYKDFYNTALLYYTFGMYLIAVQTSVPSIKTRKTHPGCVRSFHGFPFEGTGDFSSVTYLGCIAYDIRESGEPWNVLKGKKQEAVTQKIKSVITDVLLDMPDVKRKMEEKTTYLLTNPASEIPEEHDIAKWTQFLPPLVKYTVRHLVNISPEFKKSLLSDLRTGSVNQRERILVVQSKIIQFSLALIEKIQEVVKKHHLILHSSGNEPYLENACCESDDKETTVGYFSRREPVITEYNQIVTQLSNMIEDITAYSKGGIFYSNVNTKNKYPTIINEFSEKTIYMAFIHYCKFKSLIPIPPDLLPICTDKPDTSLLLADDTLERSIQKLKEDGRNYTNEQFLRMLQIVSKHSIIHIDVNKPEVSTITKLLKTIEAMEDENDDKEPVEKSLRELITNALDRFGVATENYTREVRDLNNFLSRHIENMKADIIEYVTQNAGSNISKSAIRKLTNTVNQLSTWVADTSNRNDINKISDDKLYTIVHFYKEYIENFVSVFPNIILNRVDYNNTFIPKYHDFSRSHANKLVNYIAKHYEKLRVFYGGTELQNILTTIQKSGKNILRLAETTPAFSSIKLTDDKKIIPVFDERTSRHLFEYYLLRIFVEYMDLSNENDMIVREVRRDTAVTDIFATEYLEDTETAVDLTTNTRLENNVSERLLSGNKKLLRQKTAQLIAIFFDILHTQKETIDISYEEIQDRVFKLREREKDMVTDRLKRMTDEERDADTILKVNKLGMYSKGMLKGLTTLDKDFYDEEQDFRDKMTQAERKIRKGNAEANDDNIDMLVEEYMEQEYADGDIEEEVNDMSYMNETYFDGNTDGVGAPEEEYDDYANDY